MGCSLPGGMGLLGGLWEHAWWEEGGRPLGGGGKGLSREGMGDYTFTPRGWVKSVDGGKVWLGRGELAFFGFWGCVDCLRWFGGVDEVDFLWRLGVARGVGGLCVCKAEPTWMDFRLE